MARTAHRNQTANASDLHRQWLELVDIEGPFLAIPPLKRVWPNGIPDFRANHPDRFDILAVARKDFETAWEALDREPDSDSQLDAYRAARDAWVETVLRDVAGWAESLQWGAVAGVQAQSPNRAVTVTAHAVLVGSDGTGALVHVVDPTDSLRQTPSDLWAATPVDRLEALLRENDVAIGIVTDGRWWGLVHAGEGKMPASGIVDALTWIEEPRARDAFLTLIGRQHIIGGDPAERLPALFDESVAAAEEITEALGAQVRRAVELLIQSFSESATEAKRRGQPDPLPARTHDTYEAAVTVMMRTVFLLFAEERGLLPSGELFEQGYGISRELDRLVAESAAGEEALDATSLTWHRLLASSQALYQGASFENLRMPAYGGSLFDPGRFPFLTATNEHGGLAVTVSDRVMLHVLRSVQIANVKGEARRISFRDIDVEQIGYIYEGLLGYTCAKVDQPVLGIIGTTGAEPEIPLVKLEGLAAAHPDPKELATAIREWIAEDQPSAKPSSVAAIAKAIQVEPDPSAVSALTQTVGDDTALRDRITLWLGLVRRDLRNHPSVVLDGGLLVKESPSRKNAGAHYTPKSLAEEVVLHALQPLCYSPGPHQTANEGEWKLKTSDEILGLKVADIACGSGAFLVAAARYLAERVVEAWMSEDPSNAQRKDLYTRAIRQVVANCLYGADINDMAVEMCKLSLWLVSLDRDLPFSFVDDKVFLGNSLLGLTSLDQLRKLHIDPKRVPADQRFDIFDVDVDFIIRKAVDLRERLATEIDDDDPARSSAAKNRQLNELHQVTASLRQIADGVIAAGLSLGGKPGKALDDAYDNLRLAVKQAHPGPNDVAASATMLDGVIMRNLTPTVATDYARWQPLHWVLQAPDVVVERRGFDAVVGNPPFLGGTKISPAMGSNVRDWMVNQLANGTVGKVDLVAYFVVRAAQLLNPRGTIGLIATNSLAQGATRESSLEILTQQRFTLTRAVRSMAWPTGGVNLGISIAWGTYGKVDDTATRILDGQPTTHISTSLEPSSAQEEGPIRLLSNVGIANLGCKLRGQGFLLSAEEAQGWLSSDPSLSEVVKLHLSGTNLTSHPTITSDKYVIDFGDMSEAKAKTYSVAWEHVTREVLPERARAKTKSLRERWWQFESKALDMRASIAGLSRYIALPEVSKLTMPVFVDSGPVCNHKVVVIGSDDSATFAVLSSSFHWLWAVTHGGTLEDRPSYSPSACFNTFPIPSMSTSLASIGDRLIARRCALQQERALGLTNLYNLVNDPLIVEDSDVLSLRAIHVELDEAVLDAYGWSDLQLDHGFHAYRQMERWTVSPAARVEILDRLLAENHRRAAADASQVKAAPKGRKRKVASKGMEEMFS